MTNGAQAPGSSVTYRVLRQLGSRGRTYATSYAAIREPNELVVVHRFVRVGTSAAQVIDNACRVRAEAMALLLRDARCLAKNWHPNLGRVRHVDLLGFELFVATEFVDGVKLDELLAETTQADGTSSLSHGVLARILVDVLTGLHALHGLRDAMNAQLGAYHGELSPSSIVVGKDGVARVVAAFRPRPVAINAHSDGVGYAAPEILDADATEDARADVYSVGAILWEALAGRRLYDESEPSRVAQRQREEEPPTPRLPEGSPFAALADIAMTALSFDPALRYRTAADFASEIRRVAGPKMATGSAVAQRVTELFGDKIRSRRAELDPRRASGSDAPPATPSMRPAEESEDERASGSRHVVAHSGPVPALRLDPAKTSPELEDLPGPRDESAPDILSVTEANVVLRAHEAAARPEATPEAPAPSSLAPLPLARLDWSKAFQTPEKAGPEPTFPDAPPPMDPERASTSALLAEAPQEPLIGPTPLAFAVLESQADIDGQIAMQRRRRTLAAIAAGAAAIVAISAIVVLREAPRQSVVDTVPVELPQAPASEPPASSVVVAPTVESKPAPPETTAKPAASAAPSPQAPQTTPARSATPARPTPPPAKPKKSYEPLGI